jgi:primosomal protein N' (replication factor Y) (superfamily II helicase)
MFARLAVNVPTVTGLFDYFIPPELAPHIQTGCLVAAPFGNQIVQGVILQLLDSPSVENPKPIIDLLDPAPVLTSPQLALAILLADSTLSPLASIVSLMLPVGLSQQADVLYSVIRDQFSVSDLPVYKRLLNLLRERGPLRGRQIDSHFAKVDWRKVASALIKKGILSAKHVLPPPRVRPKFLRVAQLSVPPEEAEAEMPNLGTKQTLARRQAALRFLIQQPDAINLSWVYAETGCNLADLQELEERGLIRLFESEIFRDPLENIGRQINKEPGAQALELTPEQTSALDVITGSLKTHNPFLLHGVTGSGKTDHQARQAGHYPRPRNSLDAASGPSFSLTLSRAGWTCPLKII